MKKDRRWLKSAIATSEEAQVTLPWQRGAKHKPESLKAAPAAQQKPRGMAAR